MARIRRLLRPGPQALDWRALVPVLGLALALSGTAFALASRDAVLPAGGAAAGLSTGALADFGTCPKPRYPQADLDAGHEGTVTLALLVDATGAVRDSRVEHSSGYPTMDDAAHSVLRTCGFRPALEHGRPVTQWTQVKYVWTLG